ncbi:MAG TPA: tetratricopeptide repeat protein, partial [Chitinophagales bacterium]|nr:tetratricopeptide repeat protein [Chitinophagales bacterium]
DGMVLRDNHLVLKGASAIPDILTHDSFYGAIGISANLAGGRYRPLSLVSFAIEVSIFGEKPFVHHLFNVFLYAITAIVLLNFLNKFIFPKQPMASLIAGLLFVFHPIHTEVVANIKSRDEIFSLLFLLLTLHYLLLYLKESKRSKHFFLAMLFYFLALFSKENGLIFVVMIPLTIFFFTKEKIRGIILNSLPFIALAAFYVLVRYMLLGFQNNTVSEVMDNPYVLATASQKYATILFVFLKYLQLLFFPHPLTFDYSYHQIPYRDFSDPLVLFSLIIYLSLGVYALISLRKKDFLGWCIIFFFGALFIVSNIFFNVGAPLAERFLYQATVPFVIVIVELCRRIFLLTKTSKAFSATAVSVVLTIILIASSYATITRNTDWKSDDTIFLHDVKISSNSARANTYAGISLIRITDEQKDAPEKRLHLLKAVDYLKAAQAIKPDYLPTLLNMGVAYSRLDSPDAAEAIWAKARVIEPGNPNYKSYDAYLFQKFYDRGMAEGAKQNFFAAVVDLEKAVKYNPSSADAWFNLGGAYFSVKNFEKAKSAWEKALQLNPDLPKAKLGIATINQMPSK